RVSPAMTQSKERDYVLGTHEAELARLGVQHRAWRSVVLDCWQTAGITVGSQVLDVGAGPGYATVDLSEIVGPSGKVVAIERSTNFVKALTDTIRARELARVRRRAGHRAVVAVVAGEHRTHDSLH